MRGQGAGVRAGRALLTRTPSPANAHDEGWRALATLPQRWTAPVFPLKAADFMALGIEKGPALGAALRAAEEAWIEAGFPSDATAGERIVADVAAGRKMEKPGC